MDCFHRTSKYFRMYIRILGRYVIMLGIYTRIIIAASARIQQVEVTYAIWK